MPNILLGSGSMPNILLGKQSMPNILLGKQKRVVRNSYSFFKKTKNFICVYEKTD
jgi:hypothetical protein